MDWFFNMLRKTLVGTIALIFAFVVIYTPQQYNHIEQAEAGWPTFETNPVLVGSSLTTSINTTVNSAKEMGLDSLALMIGRVMISQMLRSLTVWINSGFKGSPAFIQDLDRFLLDAADQAAGEYISRLGDIGSFICSPFRLDIQLALSLKYQKAREYGKGRRDSCTLSGIVDNVENFFDGTVNRKNFWQQWVEVSSKPERYTPYGQMFEAEMELDAVIRNARGQKIQIANWGDSFLSNEVCELIEGPTGAAAAPSSAAAAGSSIGGGLAAAAAPTPTRKHCVISTPGKFVSEQVNKAFGVGQDQLVAADEINEVVSALIAQIANQALMGTAGLLGLTPRTGYTTGGYGSGSYVDEMVEETRRSAGSFIADGYNQLADKLALQEDYNKMATEYIPKLLTIINNPIVAADIRDRAQIAYDDAIMVKDTTAIHITKLRPLVTEFETLQRELGGANVTEARRQAIINRQTQILNEGGLYRAYTEERMRASYSEWADITRT
jgi:hypothetical protein